MAVVVVLAISKLWDLLPQYQSGLQFILSQLCE